MQGPWEPGPPGQPQPAPVSPVLVHYKGCSVLPRRQHRNPFISKNREQGKKKSLSFPYWNILPSEFLEIPLQKKKRKKQQQQGLPHPITKTSYSQDQGRRRKTIKLKRHHAKTWSCNEASLKTYPLTVQIAKQFLSLHRTLPREKKKKKAIYHLNYF